VTPLPDFFDTGDLPFMRIRICLVIAAAAVLFTPVSAGLDIDFGAAIRIGDDTDLYFAISSRYFDQDRNTVEAFAVRYNDPDDLAVSLFICKQSGRSPEEVFTLFRRGLSWWDISVKLGIPLDVWFVEVDSKPGPPYGKAYGHWKNHKRDRRHVVVLSNIEMRDLVAARMIHEYYDVPVVTAMEWRARGLNLRGIMADEYHKRRGKPAHRGGKAAHRGGKPAKHPQKAHPKHKR